jgi:hypothetical protein
MKAMEGHSMNDSTENTLLTDEQIELEAAKISFCKNRARGRAYQLAAGRDLMKIKSLWEKLGISFKDRVLPELGIPYTTSLRYMALAEQPDGTEVVLEDEDGDETPLQTVQGDRPDTHAGHVDAAPEVHRTAVERALSITQNRGTVTIHVSGLDPRQKVELSLLKKRSKVEFDRVSYEFICVLLTDGGTEKLSGLLEAARKSLEGVANDSE